MQDLRTHEWERARSWRGRGQPTNKDKGRNGRESRPFLILTQAHLPVCGQRAGEAPGATCKSKRAGWELQTRKGQGLELPINNIDKV